MMTSAQIAFKAVDIVFYHLQNGIKFQNIEWVKNVSYKPEGGRVTSGDIFYDKNLAAKGRKFPVIVYIHGGGFVMGDKDYRWSVGEYFAHNGYFVYNIDYRMPPEGTYFDMGNDVIDGVNYVQELAKEYNLDLDKIIITGDSSGGYLTSLVAAAAFNDEYRNAIGFHEVKVKLAAIAPFCGIYDIGELLKSWLPFGIIPSAAGMLFGMKLKRDMSNIGDFEYYNYVSPIEFVNDKWCPAYIIWSDEDIVCVNQGDKMYQKLKENCPVVGADHAPGFANNHCYHLVYRTPIAQRAMAGFIKFLKSIDLY